VKQLIVINSISKGARDGFAKTAVQTVGYICSVIAAVVISSIAAAIIYSTAAEPALVSYLAESMENSVDAESILSSVTAAVNELPAVSHLLFDFSKVSESLANSVSLDHVSIAENICESVIEPVIYPILKTLLLAILLIILFPVVTAVAKGSKAVNDVPVIGKANGFFGGVFGILNGVLKLAAAAFILDHVISAGLFPEYFSEEIIGKTFLFRWIYFTLCGNNFLM
jgi:hypothetical protein